MKKICINCGSTFDPLSNHRVLCDVCRHTPHNKEYGKRYSKSISGKYNSYKRSAASRKLEMSLTKDEFKSFWGKACHYCGCEIDTIGLDRINNDIGYRTGNVVPCCIVCNRMKSISSKKDFLSHILRIVKKHLM